MRRQNTVQSTSPRVYLCYLFLALSAALLPGIAHADPTLPTIPAGTFTVPAATGIAATDTTNLKNTLTAAANSANHGGTVIVPAGTYVCNDFSIPSSVNLQLSSGANIQNASPLNTLINVSSGHDIEITGSGTIDGRATNTKGNGNLITISNVTNLLVSGVTICNSSKFHLVPSNITNLTIDGININDTYTKNNNGGAYLGNTDGIDYSGSHILIKNCNINDGDDDIVAKPGSVYCSDITIKNCTIGDGHGISVGGQTGAGLNGLTVSNCTFNNTTNGLRMKAGPYNLTDINPNTGLPGTPYLYDIHASPAAYGNGGVVKNVLFTDITMTGVAYPIIINSWYVNADHYGYNQVGPSSLRTTTNPGETLHGVNQQNNSVNLDPFFDNIRYTNITATGASNNVAIIYGLDSQAANPGDPVRNIDNISFNNVSLSGSYLADIYYASRLDISGLTVNGIKQTNNQYGNSILLSGYTIWQGGNVTKGNGSATDWVNTYNWTSDPTIAPSGAGKKVAFGNQDASNSIVDMVSSPKIVGYIYFSPDTSTTLQSSGGYSLTLDNGSSASAVDVEGTHTIAAPVLLNSDLNITSSSSGTLNLTGGLSGAHAVNIQSGNVNAASVNISTLTIAGGSVLTIQAIPGGPTGETLTPVPEPSTAILFGVGALGISACAWLRRSRGGRYKNTGIRFTGA